MTEILNPHELIPESELYEKAKAVFGFNFISGLPCGELRHFIAEAADDKESLHLQSTNEREAVAIAEGSWLAGRTPALYMQNSGLFEASNDIASLLIPCKTPVLFVVSWRGAPGETATQHLYTGPATVPLLDSFGLPYIATDITSTKLADLKQQMENLSLPGVILVKRQRFNDAFPDEGTDIPIHTVDGLIENEGSSQLALSRESALEVIFNVLSKQDAVFSSTGLISRSVFENHDGENQFYNAGAFGLTSTIALGFAANRPDMRTVVIEGDGSVLTNVGALNVIGHSSPDNYLHIILDNQAYISCSGEKTYGSGAIPLIARDFGYKQIFTVQTPEGLQRAISRSSSGPSMVHVQIDTVGKRDFARPLEMAAVATRFKQNFSKI